MTDLQFLKLGGSLITDKNNPHTARPDVLARLAGEIAAARQADPRLCLLLGHGSGSFGHVPAHRYGTRHGVHDAAQWLGFVEVWREARALNELVAQALSAAGLPVIAFPPSATITAADGAVQAWDLTPLRSALQAGLIPLVFGDVVFDTQRGGTILSTEDLFNHLARALHPARIHIAGIEPGVWADYPHNTHITDRITPRRFTDTAGSLHGSAAVDVTGGMREKVEQMLALTALDRGLRVTIFSGLVPGAVRQALLGAFPGTLIAPDD